jgi:uncharacterized membrane protein YhaH (DUF805 family)
MEAFGSILLYAVFSLLATIGAYLALASARGRAAGLRGALATGLFFLLLYWGLAAIWCLVGPAAP